MLATIFPVTFVPIGIPNSSPNATLTAGAVCTTTYESFHLVTFLIIPLYYLFLLMHHSWQVSIH